MIGARNHIICTLYTVHCTLYTVHCTLYIVHCTLYTTCFFPSFFLSFGRFFLKNLQVHQPHRPTQRQANTGDMRRVLNHKSQLHKAPMMAATVCQLLRPRRSPTILFVSSQTPLVSVSSPADAPLRISNTNKIF